MIHISIHDGSLETPFREIGTTLSSNAGSGQIQQAAWDLVMSHNKLRQGNTPMQKAYRDE